MLLKIITKVSSSETEMKAKHVREVLKLAARFVNEANKTASRCVSCTGKSTFHQLKDHFLWSRKRLKEYIGIAFVICELRAVALKL